MVKLPKDPKPEELTFDNIIEKENIICTSWVAGIVLNNIPNEDDFIA